MSLVEDLKAAEADIAEAQSARTMVDSLVELGEGALGYLEIAKDQVAEQLPALTEKAEEVVAATKRHIPKALVAAAALAAAGALVVGAVVWKRHSDAQVPEGEFGYSEDTIDVAEPELSDAEAAVAAAEEVVSQAAEDLTE